VSFTSRASSIVQPTSSHDSPQPRRLHPKTVQLFWRRFGDAQVGLFASPDTFHCQLFYSLSEVTLGMDALTHICPRGLCKYMFSPVRLPPVVDTISSARAYALKWNLFVEWCFSLREGPRRCQGHAFFPEGRVAVKADSLHSGSVCCRCRHTSRCSRRYAAGEARPDH